MDQNLVTRGDLPRFVMDSYEECRGPPWLFLIYNLQVYLILFDIHAFHIEEIY